jgi:hypothetical protein
MVTPNCSPLPTAPLPPHARRPARLSFRRARQLLDRSMIQRRSSASAIRLNALASLRAPGPAEVAREAVRGWLDSRQARVQAEDATQEEEMELLHRRCCGLDVRRPRPQNWSGSRMFRPGNAGPRRGPPPATSRLTSPTLIRPGVSKPRRSTGSWSACADHLHTFGATRRLASDSGMLAARPRAAKKRRSTTRHPDMPGKRVHLD